jgi:hypothetical protein
MMRLYVLFPPTPETPAQEISTRLFFFCNPLSFWSIRSKKRGTNYEQHTANQQIDGHPAALGR